MSTTGRIDIVRNTISQLFATQGFFFTHEIRKLHPGVERSLLHRDVTALLHTQEIVRAALGKYVPGPKWNGVVAAAPRTVQQMLGVPAASNGTNLSDAGRAQAAQQRQNTLALRATKNPATRTPALLLLDTSGSMKDSGAIAELNAGLAAFRDDLQRDSATAKSAEIAIVTFGKGGVRVMQDFTEGQFFNPPALDADEMTPMGEAIVMGLDLLDERKELYKKNGLLYFRPVVFMISDGEPTDDTAEAARRIHEGDTEQARAFSFFAVAVSGANLQILSQISRRPPAELKDMRFVAAFQWLSNSISRISQSKIGESVVLAAITGWSKH